MKLTTLCLALVVALCYLVTVESSPIQNDAKKEVGARQSGPVVSPPVPGEDADDDDDDDDGRKIFFSEN
jgi:hypothetical protein